MSLPHHYEMVISLEVYAQVRGKVKFLKFMD